MAESVTLRSLENDRPSTLKSFADYKVSEAENCAAKCLSSVGVDGSVLEYETLELRVHPSEVCIDNETYPDRTVLTIDSANRPGTLVEVVQCLTELGLDITYARISSDGGWFVDEFQITEPGGGKVEDSRKLSVISKVLSVHYELDPAFALESKDSQNTVVELSGPDRVGLLADVTQLITNQGCDVRAAAVWTCRKHVAIVMSVTEAGAYMDEMKAEHLKPLLSQQFRCSTEDEVTVQVSQVKGVIHYERRLHQLMLAEEVKVWDRCCESDDEPPSSESLESNSTGSLDQRRNSCSSDVSLPSFLDPLSDDLDPEFRSPKFSAPEVNITECKQHNYWMVNIKSKDRQKLFFDTLCTLADLEFDVYHGSIDCENGMAHQVYYCRRRNGDYEWHELDALKLRHMLLVSIQRRFPKGRKVYVREMGSHVLAKLTATFRDAGFCITRAMVRPYSAKGVHTFHVLDANERPPDKRKVMEVLQTLGGRMLQDSSDMRNDLVSSPPDGRSLQSCEASNGAFAFVFSSKSHLSSLSVSPASSSGSPASTSYS